MRVMVVGGGIGGLATALALHARGIEAVVFERSATIRELGVGINTLPHAIGVLAGLGLLPALDAVAIRTRELTYANRHGQTVWRELRGTGGGARVSAILHPPRPAAGRSAGGGGAAPPRPLRPHADGFRGRGR